MEKRSDIQPDIKKGLILGSEFSAFIDAFYDYPELHLFAAELDSARNWIAKIDDVPEPEFLEKTPQIVELLKSCGRAMKGHGYSFLGDDFERLARNLAKILQTEQPALKGEDEIPF